MRFGDALKEMQDDGAAISRESWLEPNKYVYWVPEEVITAPDGSQRNLVAHARFVRPHKNTVEPWLPSFDALAADDWFTVDLDAYPHPADD